MDKLKNFIDENRQEFDDEQLPLGHFERFEKKLQPERAGRRVLFTILGFAAAACIALFLIYKLPFGSGMNVERSYVCEMRQEIEELQLFYTMQMSEAVAQMEDMYELDQTPGAAELLEETKKVVNDTQTFEKVILPTLPCSDESLFALTQHYGNSLKSINNMLEYMEQIVEIDNTK